MYLKDTNINRTKERAKKETKIKHELKETKTNHNETKKITKNERKIKSNNKRNSTVT